jgi:hypothetical protein
MSSVTASQLAAKILSDLNIVPGQGFRYSKLRSKAILIEPEAEQP